MSLTETFPPFDRQGLLIHLLIRSAVLSKRASLRQRATLRIFRVRTISCSDELVEGGWREAAKVVAAVGWVMPPNYPSKESHFASSQQFPRSGQA